MEQVLIEQIFSHPQGIALSIALIIGIIFYFHHENRLKKLELRTAEIFKKFDEVKNSVHELEKTFIQEITKLKTIWEIKDKSKGV